MDEKGVELVRPSEDDPSAGIRDMDSLGEIAYTRPVLSRVIPDVVDGSRMLVIGCSPNSFGNDVGPVCAAEQAKVLAGEAQEVGMHLEVFGW
jgi:hypothetical protein